MSKEKSAKKQERGSAKKNALVLCQDFKRFWTTQKQFWQWFREGVIRKIGDQPLTGEFVRRDDENLVLRRHTVLNRACPAHLAEALAAHRMRVVKRRRHLV